MTIVSELYALSLAAEALIWTSAQKNIISTTQYKE
jgi:hypothetical protein